MEKRDLNIYLLSLRQPNVGLVDFFYTSWVASVIEKRTEGRKKIKIFEFSLKTRIKVQSESVETFFSFCSTNVPHL